MKKINLFTAGELDLGQRGPRIRRRLRRRRQVSSLPPSLDPFLISLCLSSLSETEISHL